MKYFVITSEEFGSGKTINEAIRSMPRRGKGKTLIYMCDDPTASFAGGMISRKDGSTCTLIAALASPPRLTSVTDEKRAGI